MVISMKSMAQKVMQASHKRQLPRVGSLCGSPMMRTEPRRQQRLYAWTPHDIPTIKAQVGPIPQCWTRPATAAGPHATETNRCKKTKASIRRSPAQTEQTLALGRAAADRVDELRDERFICFGIRSRNIFRIDPYIHQRARIFAQTKRLKNLSNAVGSCALPAPALSFQIIAGRDIDQ